MTSLIPCNALSDISSGVAKFPTTAVEINLARVTARARSNSLRENESDILAKERQNGKDDGGNNR